MQTSTATAIPPAQRAAEPAPGPRTVHIDAFQVTGLSVRTRNSDENDPATARIGALWDSFFSHSWERHLPAAGHDGRLFGVYSAYESDAQGAFDVTVGVATDPGANAGANAKARINGLFDVTSATNTFENAVAGVTFKAAEVTTAPVDITVAKDASVVKKSIEDFVIAYNAANQALNDLTKYDKATGVGGLLQGDSTAVSLQNQLRNVVQSMSSSTGPYKTLSSIGLGIIQGGDLSIDSTKLNAALQNPDAVKALFIGADGSAATADGVAEKIKTTTSRLLDASGFFASKDKQLKTVLERNASEVKRINARADGTEALLKARYTALDTQMSKLNALNAYIGQQVTAWNNQKG